MRNYTRTSEELRALESKKLRSMLRFAYENVPLYHQWFTSNNLMPDDIRDNRDLTQLPTLTRADITNNPPEYLSSKARVVVKRTTSGTTGKPVRVHWDSIYADTVIALKMRRLRIAGVKLTDKAVWAPYFGSSVTTSHPSGTRLPLLENVGQILFGTIDVRNPVFNSKIIPLGNKNLPEVISALSSEKPKMVLSRPSFLRRIGRTAKRSGIGMQIPFLFCEGEIVSGACRRELTELYGGEVFETYAASEFGTLGFQCRLHDGIHLDSDQFVFEVLRDDEPVSAGERGEVLITCVGNHAMPLIRYKIGDVVVPEKDERCDCGSNLPRLRVVEGRLNDGLISCKGQRIAPGSIVEHLESQVGLRDFQIVQIGRNELTVKVQQSVGDHSMMSYIEAYLRDLLCKNARVHFVTWNEHDMPPKYRPILVSVPPTN